MQHDMEDAPLALAPILIPPPYVSPINHLIHHPRENLSELDAKYATMLENNVFRSFVSDHDSASSHAPSASGPVYHPGLRHEQIVCLFEELHAGIGMDVLTAALNNDGFVVIMDEWRSPVVYYTNENYFHQWMTNPVAGVSSFSVFNQ
jgi:hypothetical protein